MKIGKCIKISVFLMLIMLFSADCKNTESKEKYITITNTYSYKEDLVMDVLTYNLTNQSISKTASIPYTSQYPLTMYSASNDKVYYTALSDDKKGDELFVMDRHSKKAQQLTNEFFAINNIYPLNEDIFIAGVRRSDDTAVKPYIYDKETKKVKEIPITNDFFISCAHYDPVKQDLYVSGYLEKEDRNSFDEQDEDGDVKGITNYIYKFDGNRFKLIYSKRDCYIKSITSCGNDLIIKWGTTYFDEDMNLSKICVENEKEESFEFEKSEIKNIADDGLIYADTDNVLYIRQTEKKNDIVYQLCSYDNHNGKINILYEAPAQSAINNAQVLLK